MGELLGFSDLIEKPIIIDYRKIRECCDCGVKVKPSLSECSFSSGVGYTQRCADSAKAAWQKRYDAGEPFDCGVHKKYFDTVSHNRDCLKLVCPWCGETSPNEFLMDLNHGEMVGRN